MRVALVHDYLNEYGGAERVLETLSEMFPQAPIYTAFAVTGSTAWQHFKNRTIIESRLAPILKWHKLYSPLRFLAPWVWEGFDFKGFDVVISSASWYITKGILTGPETKHICYCHTPPRYLYGYKTSIEWQRYWPVRLYAKLVNGFLRRYDYLAAQRVDQFVVNSENVAARVKKLYGRDSVVIYPPVEVTQISEKLKVKTFVPSSGRGSEKREGQRLAVSGQAVGKETEVRRQKSEEAISYNLKPKTYFLIVSRVVGAKGIEMALRASKELGFNLKIVGEKAGLRWSDQELQALSSDRVEWLGRLPDDELWQVYAGATAFLALAEDEDFGMTVVEAQAAGTPVIAYYGGGYKETVVEGKTGIFFHDYSVKGLEGAIRKFADCRFQIADLRENAGRFSKEQFVAKIQDLITL